TKRFLIACQKTHIQSLLNMSEEKITLNIGGIKYETFRSTLTAQPETLLGSMFRDQIKNSVNEDEYFFDRNGKAFYYIMEFYRTGKLLWSTEAKESQVTYQQLKEELDYFQINRSKVFSSLVLETAKSTIDRFISSLEELIISQYINFDSKITLSVSNNELSLVNEYSNYVNCCLSQFKECAFEILENMENQIEKHLVETFSELELKWKCQRMYSYYSSENPFFEIDITFSSPVKKLLNSEDTRAHISFTKVPINTPVEKIILNVGGKKYETFQSTLVSRPETLLGTMFQDRNKCMRHPINGNEYFFDRNSDAFHYIMEFYRTGKLTWPVKSEQVTRKQLEEELDYFQIPFDKSTILCSSALETVRNNVNNLISAFEELIIQCCDHLQKNIDLEIDYDVIYIHSNNEKKRLSNVKFLNACSILSSMQKQIGDHLTKSFSDLGLNWEFHQRDYHWIYVIITLSFKNVYSNLK
ncbi:20492_t:CDS:2, partial [Dentiscutata erythropus]